MSLDPIYDECRRQLEGWHRQYEGRPGQELEKLCLLAMEREEIVAVAYSESVVERRLARLALPPPVDELVRHALHWIWRDEAMHTLFIRGVLWNLGRPLTRVRTLGQLIGGFLGGWATSVQHHLRWSEAPLSRFLAGVFVALGRVSRRVSPEVLPYLHYQTFRSFCDFSLRAERTAELCWARMAELAQVVGRPHQADFRRIRTDELHHARVFKALQACFDEGDQWVSHMTPGTFASMLSDISPHLVPCRWRSHPRVGLGGPVWVQTGRQCEGRNAVLESILLSAGLSDLVRAAGRPVQEVKVVIKTTFMMGYSREDRSSVVDVGLIDALAGTLHAMGCHDVVVADGQNLYDRYFSRRSVEEVAAYFGFASPHYRIENLSTHQEPHTYRRGLHQARVSSAWKGADVRIVVGKLRSHPVDQVALTIAALEGTGERLDDFMFYERQAERDTAQMMILDDFPPHLAILDAWCRCPDGMVGLLGCPHPRHPHRLYASNDCLALDVVAARHAGLPVPYRSPLLRTARDWFADPTPNLVVMGCDEPIHPWHGPLSGDIRALVSLLASPVYMLASGRGATFIPEMDTQAFPPRQPPSLALSAQRWLWRRLLGYTPPRPGD